MIPSSRGVLQTALRVLCYFGKCA